MYVENYKYKKGGTIMRKLILLSSAITLMMFSNGLSQPLVVGTQGSKAILFNFAGLSNLALTGYQGGIGGKYFIQNGLAIRGLLLFGINNSTTNSSPEFTDNKLTLGIGGGLEYHLPISTNVSPYVGGIVSYENSAETVNPGGTKRTTSTFALGAVGGVEYFFNQNISLSAEYQFGISSATTTTTGTPNQNVFTFGFQTAGLTMGVYF